MKNYIIGLFCITFLFACGGSEDSSSSEVVQQKDNSAAKAFMKEFSDDYMASCAAVGEEQGLTFVFTMLDLDYNDYCKCTLDAALAGETYESMTDATDQTRIYQKAMNYAQVCTEKFMPM